MAPAVCCSNFSATAAYADLVSLMHAVSSGAGMSKDAASAHTPYNGKAH